MPGGHDSLYYSIDIGPAHIIMFSTEVYIAFETLEKDLVKQYNWLEEDLKVVELRYSDFSLLTNFLLAS